MSVATPVAYKDPTPVNRARTLALNWKGPAKMKAPPKGTEGVTYIIKRGAYGGRQGRRKATLADCYRTREVCDRSQAVSDEIRKASGLKPVPPNHYRQALERTIRELEASESAKPRKATRKVEASEDRPPTAADVKRARQKRDRDKAASDRELAEMVKRAHEAKVPMRELADAMGMSRQALYLYLDRVK